MAPNAKLAYTVGVVTNHASFLSQKNPKVLMICSNPHLMFPDKQLPSAGVIEIKKIATSFAVYIPHLVKELCFRFGLQIPVVPFTLLKKPI